MSFFKNGNDKLYFEIHGDGEPLLIIPGGGTDGRYYLGLTELLKKNFKVILPDPRGLGRSEKGSREYNVDLLASDLISLLDHLKIESISIIGHSLGGMIAQHVAYKYPTYVKNLILLATDLKFSAFGKHCCKTAGILKKEAPLKALIHVIAIWNFSDTFFQDEKSINNMIAGAEQDPYPLLDEVISDQMKIIDSFDSSNELKKIKAKTLVIGCEKDIIFPPKSAKRLATEISSAVYYEIQNAAHSVHVEHPELIAKIIKEFCEKNL